jgi:RNA polymerase sigma-70 factor (ECF subfamily)
LQARRAFGELHRARICGRHPVKMRFFPRGVGIDLVGSLVSETDANQEVAEALLEIAVDVSQTDLHFGDGLTQVRSDEFVRALPIAIVGIAGKLWDLLSQQVERIHVGSVRRSSPRPFDEKTPKPQGLWGTRWVLLGQGPPEAKPAKVTENADVLMARVRERNADAFESLYDAYHRVVYGVALRMLGEGTLAEDITQTVFLKVWNAPNLYRGGSFPAWIVRMTRNRAIDLLRGRAARPETELPESLPEAETIEDAAFARLDAERVRRALATLPPEQREPIELGFFGGITHAEIARRSGTPLGTVKTRIRTGLHKLRAALDEAVAV